MFFLRGFENWGHENRAFQFCLYVVLLCFGDFRVTVKPKNRSHNGLTVRITIGRARVQISA